MTLLSDCRQGHAAVGSVGRVMQQSVVSAGSCSSRYCRQGHAAVGTVGRVMQQSVLSAGSCSSRYCPRRLGWWPENWMNIFWSPLTKQLIPPNRVLLEKLTGSQPVKKLPSFYVTRRFIIALTSPRHLSLSWARSIQFIPPHPTSRRSVLILFPIYAYFFQVVSFPQVFLPESSMHLSCLSNVQHTQPISFLIWSAE